MMSIGQSTTIAKDLLETKKDEWSENSQDAFSSYLGQAITAWDNVTTMALDKMFDGSDKSIEILYNIISDGKLLSGDGGEASLEPPKTSEAELQANIAKDFFGYAIPTAWLFSKHYAFVVDSGYPCDTKDPLEDYLSEDTMNATYCCHDDKLYYLAAPRANLPIAVREDAWTTNSRPPPALIP